MGLVGRHHGVELTTVTSTDEALAAISLSAPDCLVLAAPASAVLELLEALHAGGQVTDLPVIIRTDNGLVAGDDRLQRFKPALEPRVARSDEALAAEAALVLHGPAAIREELPRPELEGRILSGGDDDGPRPELQGRILLVDDDVRNLFALASLLEEHGLQVVFSETGRGALEILGRDPSIDLVLMDIMMPQMDGYETIKAARAMDGLQSLPIIAVTAKAMQGDREKSIAAGASDYITKPVDPAKLLSMVGGWLRA